MVKNMSEQLGRQESQLTSGDTLRASIEFLGHFAVWPNPIENPQEFSEALGQLDPRYKGGRNLVRFELEADQTEWPEETKQVIMRTAESMRMLVTETPLIGDYDVVIALGGARQSNLDRTRYAVDAAKGGRASLKHLVVVGSGRELNEDEQQNTANYAPSAVTEFDLVAGAAKTVAQENPGLITSQLFVEDKKAGTPTVVEAVLQSLKNSTLLTSRSTVAAVTTQIYQTSTRLDLERVTHQFGITEAFTAGNPSDPKIVEARTPATYLSEVLRTLRAAGSAALNEHELKVLQTEKNRQKVIEATGDDRILSEGKDGSRIVEDVEGNEWAIESDGTRWISRSYGGTSYTGPNDQIGYHE